MPMTCAEALRELELQQGAPEHEVRAAYKKMARRWHPDKNDSEEATEKFKRINDAYNTLEKVRRKDSGEAQGGAAKKPKPQRKMWSVSSLSVGDLKEDVEDVTIRLQHLWTPILLGLCDHVYDVELACYEDHNGSRHYLRCVRPYQNREFEQLFGFGSDCANYVEHKIIVVKHYTVGGGGAV